VQIRDAYAPPTDETREHERHETLVTLISWSLLLQAIVLASNGLICLLLALHVKSRSLASQLVSVSQTLADLHSLLFMAGIVPFAIFLVRANKTARAFVQHDEFASYAPVLQFTPSSMWWWFCVPILNLIKPYDAVCAVWSASRPRTRDAHVHDYGILRAWFSTWIAYWLISQLNSYIAYEVSVVTRDLLIVAKSSLGVLACFYAVRMVRALAKRQRLRAQEV